MSFYQELQLDQGGSKRYIASFKDPREKAKHIAVLIFKLLLVSAFSVGFIMLFSMVFGAENSIVGLVVLLTVQLFRVSDLGMHARHGAVGILLMYGILALGPWVAGLLPPLAAFCVNLGCILAILIVGCQDVRRSHQLILVLGYLLLLGYPVSGEALLARFAAFATGGILTALVFYRNHRNKTYAHGLGEAFREFDFSSERSRWQMRFALSISSVMLIAALVGVQKPIWIGIAAMSVFMPSREDFTHRVKNRALANTIGCGIFIVMYFLLPKDVHPYLGVIGGFAQGLSATYRWQTAFNAVGALAIATTIFGLPAAILMRIFHNVFGSLYAWLTEHIFDRIPFLAAKPGVQRVASAEN